MKKLIILVLLLTNALAFGYSQEPEATPAVQTPPAAPAPEAPVPAPLKPDNSTKSEPGIKFGFKITPSFCWFSLERTGYASDGGFLGYTYGIMTDFRLADNYYIGSGIELSQRGGKYKSDVLEVDGMLEKGKVKQRLQFIDIPVSLKLKTNEIGYSRYYGSFGFLTGFTTKANQDIDFENSNIEDRNKRGNMSDFGFINFGLLVGAGLEYNISGNTSITAGLQYHNSFVDVWSIKNATIKPNYVSLNLGIFF